MRKWLLAALAASATHAAVIRGVVVENQTGKPLLRAMVTLKPLPGTTATPQTVRTNTSGVFEFVPVPGGSYLVSAARPNYFTIQYGQKDWKATGAPVEVEQEASAFLQIRLSKLGVISGRVVDENDVGLPNHEVVVYRNTKPPQLVTKVTADERGIYRFFNLDPGSYLVKTVARVYEEGSYVPTFSKDTLKVEEARPVDVLLDLEADHIDVRPMLGRLYNIGGTVHPSAMQREGPAAGNPVVVKLTFASDMGRESAETNEGFHFNPVPIGNYELYAEGPGDGTARCQSVGGYLPFDIKERDKDPTDISMSVPCVQDTQIQIVDNRGTPIDTSKMKIMARRKDMAGNGEVQQLEILGNRYSSRCQAGAGSMGVDGHPADRLRGDGVRLPLYAVGRSASGARRWLERNLDRRQVEFPSLRAFQQSRQHAWRGFRTLAGTVELGAGFPGGLRPGQSQARHGTARGHHRFAWPV